jgi:hypothetical protein
VSDPDARWGHDDGSGYWNPEPDRPEKPEPIRSAIPELLALAGEARGVKWRDELAPALNAAQAAGWDWPRIGKAASLLIFDPQGEPRSLTDATRDPIARERHASEPPPEWREARQALERGRAK